MSERSVDSRREPDRGAASVLVLAVGLFLIAAAVAAAAVGAARVARHEARTAADLAALAGHGWLVPDALVVVERSSRSPEPEWPEAVVPLRRRRYGETTLWYGHAAPDESPEDSPEARPDEGPEPGPDSEE